MIWLPQPDVTLSSSYTAYNFVRCRCSYSTTRANRRWSKREDITNRWEPIKFCFPYSGSIPVHIKTRKQKGSSHRGDARKCGVPKKVGSQSIARLNYTELARFGLSIFLFCSCISLLLHYKLLSSASAVNNRLFYQSGGHKNDQNSPWSSIRMIVPYIGQVRILIMCSRNQVTWLCHETGLVRLSWDLVRMTSSQIIVCVLVSIDYNTELILG